MKTPHATCPDCITAIPTLSRRDFLRTATTAAAAAGIAPALPLFGAAAAHKTDSETLSATLYNSLNEAQRKELCFGFDHPLRLKVDNNWHITPRGIDKALTADQQAMVQEIFMGLHNPEYAQTVYKQVEHDSGKAGFGSSSIALFGTPGTGKFEFVLTGRHCTRRCDGDAVEGAAFGGPIFYGHAAKSFNEKADHEGNAYWYQAKRANELYQALDGKQRQTALLTNSRGENGNATIKLTGKKSGLPGLRVGEMVKDQQALMRKVMGDLLAPFRKKDSDEAMKLVEGNGFENLHIAFYKNENIGEDEVWDVWQIEGPSMVWYFRGKPHVHVWVHIRDKA
jgi:hypothetical protein